MLIYAPVKLKSGRTEDRMYNLQTVRSVTRREDGMTRLTYPDGSGITIQVPFERLFELPDGIIDFTDSADDEGS